MVTTGSSAPVVAANSRRPTATAPGRRTLSRPPFRAVAASLAGASAALASPSPVPGRKRLA
jgi:hypothetical protein